MERPKSGRVDFQRATVDLVAFHRLEQGTEVSFAEALAVVALALDELEEHRAKQRLGEYLQQQAGWPPSVVPSSRMPRACNSGTGWPWPGRRFSKFA